MTETYFRPEQQEQLARRRAVLGDEAISRAESEWAELIEAVKSERAAGTPPTDGRMLELAGRWRALIQQFTGGHPGIRRSLATMYREEGPWRASRGMVDSDLMRYVGRALAALTGAG
ncbi:MAG: TipAS antibiotic-recognition domain-containing protein [Solirubrobacteraceae bacterium]